MKDVFLYIKMIREYTDKTVNIPLTYVIFLIGIILFYCPEYNKLLNVSEWIPKKLQNIVLIPINYVYDNLVVILGALIVLFFVLSLVSYLPWWKVTPKERDFADNTTESWNIYSGIRRLLSIIVLLITYYWVYYFFLNTIFLTSHYTAFLANPLIIESGDLADYLFSLNLVFLFCYIVRSLFLLKSRTDINSIEHNKLRRYIILNSFEYRGESEEEFEIVLLKSKYLAKTEYLIAEAQKSRKEALFDPKWGERKYIISKLKNSEIYYKVLNQSRDLSEVIYHMDVLKDKKIVGRRM
ncbi:hypothetical protein BMT55_06755 [Listeria newyorkensis]|uniref:Uncharacterized protein n=1 Tax=Listeria newyorkensis TaxID=1497681 RepID=A0ABX4XNK2_9LIST|nr:MULTISPECIES: hypothetical protein [Listeria]KGL39571.1 hypothetical protein EP56_13490 [Listeriaceae bacterium FSL A5-0209]KGL44157.1 hypothetical protein EP58_06835 [Listeria newyorkensis]PNP93120.1 hypothetical protein BMT55_06755 [Listeria newyorkensis]RQW67117.1 hypothetical protein DUK53_07965 [Listeria sp. SHR_NRA_18]SQC57756.1 Uncharacterised protein [Listeria newyorkensis]